MEEDPRHFLVKIADILDELRIPYFITGGMAVLIWGRPRFTFDIDIIVELELKDVNNLVNRLSSLGRSSYIDKKMIKDALANNGEFNFIHGDTGIKVDFWALKKDEFGLSRLKRRVKRKILNKEVYFCSPEDLILSKLLWRKQGGGEKHIEDIRSIIDISKKKIDMNYLNDQAVKLDVLDELKDIEI